MDWYRKLQFSDAALYKTIAFGIAAAVNRGELLPGDKLPTQRFLSKAIGCTVGTITRAYKLAEDMGIVSSIIGSGSYVKSQDQLGFTIPDGNIRDTINLSINTPSLLTRSKFISESLHEAGEKYLYNSHALDYQNNYGNQNVRQTLLDWYKDAGLEANLGNTILSAGGQHGLSLSISALARPKDTILSESVSYHGLAPLIDRYHLQLKTVEMDDEGIIPDSLDRYCRHHLPIALYLNPRIHNPTTAQMSVDRKKAVADVARKHQIYIIEDDVLSHHANPSPPIYNFYPEKTIYLSSMSKSLAPSLRVGMIVANDDLIHVIAKTLKDDIWMTSPILADLAAHWIKTGIATQLIRSDQHELMRRAERFKIILGSYSFQYSEGSPHVWLHLPDHWSPRNFVDAMKEQNVLLKGSEDFIVNSRDRVNAVRISMTSPDSIQQVNTGLHRIALQLNEAPVLAHNT